MRPILARGGARPRTIPVLLAATLLACGGPDTETRALLDAIDAGDPNALVTALQAGADPNGVDENDVPVLVRAILEGDAYAVRQLLLLGADPNVRFEDESALALASGIDESAALALLERGAALRPGEDRRALSRAASGGFAGLVERLLEAGADPHAAGTGDEVDPLLAACAAGSLPAYEALAQAGLEGEGSALLEAAFASRDPDTIDALLVAYPEAPLPTGWLADAVRIERREGRGLRVQSLVARGGRPAQADLERALEHACAAPDPELARTLIAWSADPTTRPPSAPCSAPSTSAALHPPTS